MSIIFFKGMQMARKAFDIKAVNARFFSCFPDMNQREIADHIGVRPPTVSQWQSGEKPVSWNKLRFLVDSQGIAWDWLLDGIAPKFRSERQWIMPLSRPFDFKAVNARFFSCFPNMKQKEIAKLLKVRQPTASQWQTGLHPVSWNKLRFLVDSQGICWDWLLDGIEPKFRSETPWNKDNHCSSKNETAGKR